MDILINKVLSKLHQSSLVNKLINGSIWSIAGTTVSRIFTMIAMIFVARILGAEVFGKFGMVQITLGMIGLLGGAGLGSTATRFIAKNYKSDLDCTGRIIGLIFQIAVISALVVILILFVSSSLISNEVLHSSDLKSTLDLGILLMTANLFRGVQSGILSGFEQFSMIAKLNILEGAVSLPILILLTYYIGINGAILGLFFAALITFIVAQIKLLIFLNFKKIKIHYKQGWQEWHILYGYSMPSLFAGLIATPTLWFCMTILADSNGGFVDLGIYTAAYQWHGPIIMIPMMISMTSLPILTQEWESNNISNFHHLISLIFKMVFFVSVPLVLILSIISPWIMSLYGSGYMNGWIVLILLLVATIPHATSKILTNVVLSMGHAWHILSLNMIWAVVLLIVSFWLIPSMGGLGLSIALLLAYVVLSLGLLLLIYMILKSNHEINQ